MTDKTTPAQRDWSDVLNKLCEAYLRGYGGFRVSALAILQEFDAQNQPNLSNNGTSGVNMRDKGDGSPDNPYKTKEVAYAACGIPIFEETAPTIKDSLTAEEPKPESSWITFSNAGGIRFTGDTRTIWNIMPSLIVGNEYEYKANKFSKHWIVGKLISYTDRQAVLQTDQGYKVLQRNCTEIRAYVPEPVEHIYTVDEIKHSLWSAPYDMENYTIRGKIIRQLLKELGKNV